MVTLSNDKQTLLIDQEMGAAISKWGYTLSEEEHVLIDTTADTLFQCSWLFPFPNRLRHGAYTFEGKTFKFPLSDNGRDNALHGFIFDKPFQVLLQEDDHASMVLNYKGDTDAYPFPFEFKLKYHLKNNGFSIDIEIINNGDSPMPFGLGWHPYFNIISEQFSPQLQLPLCKKLELDAAGIPTGKKLDFDYFNEMSRINGQIEDDCFEIKKSGQTHHSWLSISESARLRISQTPEFSHLHVYMPEGLNKVAIEPMTCAVNALQAGEVNVLNPGERWSTDCKVQIEL